MHLHPSQSISACTIKRVAHTGSLNIKFVELTMKSSHGYESVELKGVDFLAKITPREPALNLAKQFKRALIIVKLHFQKQSRCHLALAFITVDDCGIYSIKIISN